MTASWHTLLDVAIRTTIVYLALLVGLRLTGTRQLGQMSTFDLVLLLIIANAVQNAMVGPDTSLAGGLVAAGEATRETRVGSHHGVLDRVRDDEQQHEVEGGHLAQLARAGEPQPDEQRQVDDGRPDRNVEQGVPRGGHFPAGSGTFGSG